QFPRIESCDLFPCFSRMTSSDSRFSSKTQNLETRDCVSGVTAIQLAKPDSVLPTPRWPAAERHNICRPDAYHPTNVESKVDQGTTRSMVLFPSFG
ncbi:unnamed protein product, partial [Mycena citricolor]